MKKKWMLILCIAAIATMAYGVLGTGAWWSVPTHVTDNTLQAATFNMTIGDTGGQDVSGLCSLTNMAPGDDPKECKIILHNEGSIPINVVWSGFALTGDSIMQDYIFLTDITDSNGETQMSDIMAYDTNGDGKMSIKEAAPVFANAYYSNPDGTYSSQSIFLAPGAEGHVSMTFAFGAAAPNETIGKSVGFSWTLTAQQLPKNAQP